MTDLDQIALDTVEAIANIDPDKLKGGRVQALAQAQCLVRDALRGVAAERDALAALCGAAAVVLERTANDTLDGRNMARRLRGVSDTSLARLKAEWDEKELAPIWETLIKVGDILGIDPEVARKVPGKPSDVYVAHLARLKAQWQAEALDRLAIRCAGNRHVYEYCTAEANDLRRQAEENSDE